MAKTYRIGTRTSPLALKQVEEVLSNLRRFYPDFKAKIVGIETSGDKEKNTPISQIEGTDFFTKEIDEALLNGRIDFAVHSAKDLADNLRKGLTVAALTKPIDPYDALVSKTDIALDKLPINAKIGTSSQRRKQGLKKYRGDFKILDIRGNIPERLRLLDETDLDAIVIAAAGLLRLGMEHRITQRIPCAILKPHPLQGCLAIVARVENLKLYKLLSVVGSQESIVL